MNRRSKFRYTTAQLHFLRDLYKIMTVEDLTEAFNVANDTNRTAGQIKAVLNNHHIRCGRKQAERLICRTRIFTERQVEFLRQNYRGRTVPELTEIFNAWFETAMTVQQINCAVKNRHIRCGRTGQFEKGNTPWNAGTKGQGLTGANRGSFKKGNAPPNRKPLGAERIDARDGRVLVKVAEQNPYTDSPTRYRLKHVVIWERAHGPVPKGLAVAFIDGDRCELDNLMLVSRAELLELNSRRGRYRKTPSELKPSVLALAKLRVRAFAKEKRREGI